MIPIEAFLYNFFYVRDFLHNILGIIDSTCQLVVKYKCNAYCYLFLQLSRINRIVKMSVVFEDNMMKFKSWLIMPLYHVEMQGIEVDTPADGSGKSFGTLGSNRSVTKSIALSM